MPSSIKIASDGTGNVRRRTTADRTLIAPVAALRRNPGSRLRVAAVVRAHDLAVSGSHIPEGSPVTVDVVLESVHDGVLVSGGIRAMWEGACRRCLETARGDLAVTVRELCVEDADDETTYPLGSDEVDLERIVHDACILELPLAPLCGEGCRGLCPECGSNRNVETCSCAERRGGRPTPA
ncbi:MAG TPA: DUF177 domain-containing protein [Acidimicrobiales bacterium]|nr:DUF177 domain-containing protein [Acidimicrobiales bacterium]